MNTKPLGELDELVLLAIGILGEDAYAFSIKSCIEDQAKRTLALATVHAALYRMEERGLVRSAMGGATATRGGRRKRLFTVTNSGFEALRHTRTVRERMWGLLGGGLRPADGLT
ncbi:MAG: PadR family transcriptional regulator [Bacteroidota bacterium]